MRLLQRKRVFCSFLFILSLLLTQRVLTLQERHLSWEVCLSFIGILAPLHIAFSWLPFPIGQDSKRHICYSTAKTVPEDSSTARDRSETEGKVFPICGPTKAVDHMLRDLGLEGCASIQYTDLVRAISH
ncbi:uncharacterized protein LOC141874780 [Acropora palmata]|uniref:uncharacterized protein LOC141874780 n=1 Tax=Acropora palmata TaxID=6131 RepID=UPI003D9FF5E3